MQRGIAGQESKPVKTTLCWENKPERILNKGKNLPKRYKEEMENGKTGPVFHLVTQVVGNMYSMKTKTACINTGVHMIGLHLMDDGVVRITPAVSREATGLESTWHLIDFMLHLQDSKDDESTEIPDLPAASTKINAKTDSKPDVGSSGAPGANKGQGAAKGKENKSTQARSDRPSDKGASLSRGLSERPSALNTLDSLQAKPPPNKLVTTASSEPSVNGGEIRYLHKLQESKDRVVWRARWRDAAAASEADVVIKWYQTKPESVRCYENEVACYRQATSMQARAAFVVLSPV
jgi:hypothetical protein